MKWEVRGLNLDGEKVVLEWGESKETFPPADKRKKLRSAGYKIYVDGKVYKE